MSKYVNKDWAFNPDGSISFHGVNRILKKRHKAENKLTAGKVIGVVAIAFCAIIDIYIMNQLFTPLFNDNYIGRVIAASGAFMGFDVAPFYLGGQIRRAASGYKINKAVSAALGLAFIVAFIVNLDLRMATKDMTIDTASSENLIAGEQVEEDTGENAVSNAMARTLCLFPVITSICSGCISFFLSDPMKKELQGLEEDLADMEADLIRTKSVLSEYDQQTTLDELIKGDQELMEKAIYNTYAMGKMYFDHVRNCLMTLMNSPSGVSYLSKDSTENFMRLMMANESPNLVLPNMGAVKPDEINGKYDNGIGMDLTYHTC